MYKTFVDKSHAIGLKVIKDVVHNHIGGDHWIMKDLPFKDWVHQWPAYTKTTYRDHTLMDPYASATDKKIMSDGWFDFHMPDLNHGNAFVQNYLTQNHIWWIEYAGVDGLRLDTYHYNDLAYMSDWAKKIKAEFPTDICFWRNTGWQFNKPGLFYWWQNGQSKARHTFTGHY